MTTTDSTSAAAFAALQSIEAGDWDRFLIRLRAAIEARRKTEGYKDHILVRDAFEEMHGTSPPPLTPGMIANQQVWVWLNDQWETRGTGLVEESP